jgi:hypothetical protein
MLREAEVALAQGITVGEICRQLSISEQSIIRWSMKYSEYFHVYIDVATTFGHRYIYTIRQ